MAGGEHGAAVLIGQDGGFKRADVPGDADDLLLVHADNGPQHRQVRHVAADGQGIHGLTGHLAQALAGDQGPAVQVSGQGVGQAHHKPPHDQGEVVLRAIAADLLLDLGKGDNGDIQPPAPGHQLPGQLKNLLPGLLAGIGGRGKVDHLQLHAPLGDHVAGHRRVDAAGQQAHGPAAHADGQAACGRLRRGVDIRRLLPDLYIYRQVRVVNVHRQVGEGLVQVAAYPLAQLDGGHGEGLVCPLALHLEAPGRCQGAAQIGLGGVQNGLLFLGTGQGPGHGDDAEHPLAGVIRPVQVAGLPGRLHIDGALLGIDPEPAESGGAAAEVGHELHFKAAAVQALQDHLAQLAQDHFVHGVSP